MATADPHCLSLRSQTYPLEPSVLLSRSSFFRSKSLVAKGKLKRRAEQVPIFPHFHAFLQKLGHILHIVQTKHIIIHTIIVSILSYVLRWGSLKKVSLSTQILSNVKTAPLRKISEIRVVNRVERAIALTSFLIAVFLSSAIFE